MPGKDLVACIPIVGGLRALRLLRLLRVGAVARVFCLVTRETDDLGVERQSWWFVTPLLVLVWVGSGIVYYHFEHGNNPKVSTLGDALYWSFITTTTVGYGDVTPPVTSEGRVLAGLLIFFSIGLIGAVSAQITTRLLRDDGAGEDARLRRIEGSLTEMATALTELLQLIAVTGRNGRSNQPDTAADTSPWPTQPAATRAKERDGIRT